MQVQRQIHTLSNGLRIVCERSDSAVAYIGVATAVGSRNDGLHPGITHFVEHTIFKGTPSRSSWHVANRMESVGGELNAYTTKEEVMVYTNSPAGYEERALQLISDLIINANFPEREIELERDVIKEEIHSYHDNAADAVYDEFDELIYASSTLAHNILGTCQSVDTITREDALEHLHRWFVPGNMVVYCVSPADPERNLRLVEKYFGAMEGVLPPRTPSPLPHPVAATETRHRGNHQANTIIGMPIFGRNDPRRHALFLLNNILGGPAMNSRLNQNLRERRGLVYTVESSVALYSDVGAFQVYFGTEPEKIRKCSSLIVRELQSLADKPLAARTFSRALEQYCGQLTVSGDHRESRAMTLAKSMLYYGEVHDISYTSEKMRTVTASELCDMAQLIVETPMLSLSLI